MNSGEGLSYLGIPELIDSSRYIWSFKCKKLPWKDAALFRNKEFTFNIIRFIEDNADLFVKFTPDRGRYTYFTDPEEYRGHIGFYFKQSALYLTIKDYRDLTACDHLQALYSGARVIYPLGVHFEDGLLNFYQARDLDLGFIKHRMFHHYGRNNVK